MHLCIFRPFPLFSFLRIDLHIFATRTGLQYQQTRLSYFLYIIISIQMKVQAYIFAGSSVILSIMLAFPLWFSTKQNIILNTGSFCYEVRGTINHNQICLFCFCSLGPQKYQNMPIAGQVSSCSSSFLLGQSLLLIQGTLSQVLSKVSI